MRVSLHTKKVVRVLNYVKKIELQEGGVRSWLTGEPYPESTGYIIPTLLTYGEREMATRSADYLVSVQNKDGSFDGLDGVPRSFDTAACIEGLDAIGYYKPALRARKWLAKMVRDDGAIKMRPDSSETHLYTMRASWILDSKAGAEYWMKTNWEPTREHYVAYALEGLLGMGYGRTVKKKLKDRDWISDDLCANAQFAILNYQLELNYQPFVEKVNNNIGLLSNSWEAKWILDMWRVVGEA